MVLHIEEPWTYQQDERLAGEHRESLTSTSRTVVS